MIHCQCAGFVGAKHIHGTEILDCIESLDDHLLTTHHQCSPGQADCDDHGQHFGSQSDGDRYCEEKGLSPVSLSEAVDHEHQWNHDHDETQHQPCEPRNSSVKCTLLRLLRQRFGHPCEVGLSACRDDDRCC